MRLKFKDDVRKEATRREGLKVLEKVETESDDVKFGRGGVESVRKNRDKKRLC